MESFLKTKQFFMERDFLPITGTFIDEITFDIPSQNWGPDEWSEDFDAMRAIGIDTVIIIRGGLRNKTIFPSKIINTNTTFDLGRFFLEETTKRKMNLFFGHYDSWDWALNGTWKEEIQINKKFMKEIFDLYGDYPSFTGWYLSHETSHRRFNFSNIYKELSEFAKELTLEKSVLISPFYPSKKIYPENFLTPEEFNDNWHQILSDINSIDYIAFQDGTVSLDELDSYLQSAKKLTDELGIELWNNVETFSRDMPIKFPPIDFRELMEKINISSDYAKKNITFEFSHFMSPNSCYPSARNLYKRYREFIGN
jgi:hypothetical protein